MKIHCDKCDRPLGDYLYGHGGVSEIAWIGTIYANRIPDVICNECRKKPDLDTIKQLLYGTK